MSLLDNKQFPPTDFGLNFRDVGEDPRKTLTEALVRTKVLLEDIHQQLLHLPAESEGRAKLQESQAAAEKVIAALEKSLSKLAQ